MDHLGDVLEALYAAPSCATFHGRARRWSDAWAVHRRVVERGGSSLSISGVSGTDDEPGRGGEETIEVWWDDRGRVRTDQGPMTTVSDEGGTTWYSPDIGLRRSEPDRHLLVAFPAWLWSTRPLIPALEITGIVPADDAGGGRSVWRIAAHATASIQLGLPTELALLGEHFEITLDHTTGIIVSMVGALADGAEVSRVTWDVFEPGVAVSDDVFDRAFPAEAATGTGTTTADSVIDRSRRRAADSSGSDTDGTPEQLRRIFEQRTLEHTQHVPTGAPPADADAARVDIAHVAANFMDADGADLVHVQSGDGLGPVGEAATRRFPDTTIEVDSVRFLDERDAVVRVTLRSGDRPLLPGFEMRAVSDGERWKVTRHSFASLMGLAGVPCPPPDL